MYVPHCSPVKFGTRSAQRTQMSSSAALWVSKALSYAILVGSLIMQAPQIYKILKARSAKGITAMGWAISVFSMTCAATS